ncbi:RNA ligase [Streptomyces brevispora]|uniref:RNA ligase n=1 Tax=Streptomyces brevispora TaxID=887462 RepID=A0A561V0B7_9ACTN|nr:RNA ligase [Streptomyces brevispora]
MRTHYPRTPHLPWSPGATSDDVRLAGLRDLTGTEVVVTEKLDGENTTLYADGLHARSLDSAHHPSRGRVKALQGRIGPRIPAGRRICGENMFARHSIPYEDLASHFYGFAVWDGDHCLGWDRTVAFLRDLGIPTPPVLWRGVFDARAERTLRALRLDTGRQEGYVVRPAEGFPAAAFSPGTPSGTGTTATASTPSAAAPCCSTPCTRRTRTSSRSRRRSPRCSICCWVPAGCATGTRSPPTRPAGTYRTAVYCCSAGFR